MNIEVDENIDLKKLNSSDASLLFYELMLQLNYLSKNPALLGNANTIPAIEKIIKKSNQSPSPILANLFKIQTNERIIGIIGFKNSDLNNYKTEIDFWLFQGFEKHDDLEKCIKALCNFVFKYSKINRIQIKCPANNISRKKIPQNLGFTLEGLERNGEYLFGNLYIDMEIYSVLKKEFRKNCDLS